MLTKAEVGKCGPAELAPLAAVGAALEAGGYDSLHQFDADVSSLLGAVLRESGRLSAKGAAAAQLKKVTL